MARVVGPDLSSRGFQLRNPMNLSYRPQDKWQQLDNPPFDNPPPGMTRLCRFKDAVYGIRAGARQLIAYQDLYDCETVADHITRWGPPPKKAPKDKNHTAQYIKFVAAALDVLPDDPINVHEYQTLRPMIEAMIDFENKGSGHPYTDAQIDKALVLAGVEPPTKPLAKTGTVKGAQVAAGGLGLTTVSALAEQAQDIAEPLTGIAGAFRSLMLALKPIAPYMLWPALALGLAGIGWIVWRRYSDQHLGLR
jgi:hypothetical protein